MSLAQLAKKSKRSRMDTLEITPKVLRSWQLPPFQRPLRVNDKVRQISDEIKDNGGVIPGVITLGVLGSHTYLLDGQHRMHAFEMSQMEEAYADVRIVEFESMAQMGQQFVELNSQIVRMRPDDVLRGLESSMPTLQRIRQKCPFVGYDKIKRLSAGTPFLSMSMMLRLWAGSSMETPVSGSNSSLHMAEALSIEEAEKLCDFLNVAHAAWGLGDDVTRMWGALNLGLCMWLWRRLVLDQTRGGTRRYMSLKAGQFQKCLMSLAADELYGDWIVGRHLSDRDRLPTYARIRTTFTRRLKAEGYDQPVRFPQPAWAAKG